MMSYPLNERQEFLSTNGAPAAVIAVVVIDWMMLAYRAWWRWWSVDDLRLRLVDDLRLRSNHRRLLGLCITLNVLEDQCTKDTSKGTLFSITPCKGRSCNTGSGDQCNCFVHSVIIAEDIY